MKKYIILAFLLLAIFVALLLIKTQHKTSTVLLQNLSPKTSGELEKIRENVEGTEVSSFSEGQSQIWEIPSDKESELIELLKKSSGAEGVEVTRLAGDYRSLFTIPSAQIHLTPSQEEILSSIKQSSGTDVSIVELVPMNLVTHALTVGFDSNDGFQQSGSIKLSLNKETSVTAIKTSGEVTANGSVWKGEVQNGNGEVFLLSNGKNMNGTVKIDNRVYSIQPLGEGIHAVFEERITNLPEEHPPRFNKKTKEQGALKDMPPNDPVENDQQYVIDVLVPYTDKAARKYLNIENDVIRLAIATTNQSFEDSKIENIKINLAYAYKTDYRESSNWVDHLDRLVRTDDRVMDEVHSHRKSHRADIVVLIVDDDSCAGESRDIFASEGTAFAVVQHKWARTYYSFAHEIGHLFGARHDTYKDPINTPFRYGHGYISRKKTWRTIMSYPDGCDNCPRLGFWSSPNVNIKGEPAGTKDTEFDARVLREAAARIANFQ